MLGSLQVWSPFREMEGFSRSFDELFDRFLGGGSFFAPETAAWAPAVESFVDGDELVVRADLPGIDPKDVEVSVTGNILTLHGSREHKREEKKRDHMYREVSYGSFERALTLPDGIKSDQIKASYHNGVLELRMPAPRHLAARKVPIEIEAKSDEKKAVESAERKK